MRSLSEFWLGIIRLTNHGYGLQNLHPLASVLPTPIRRTVEVAKRQDAAFNAHKAQTEKQGAELEKLLSLLSQLKRRAFGTPRRGAIPISCCWRWRVAFRR